jgi:hypothetical protein
VAIEAAGGRVQQAAIRQLRKKAEKAEATEKLQKCKMSPNRIRRKKSRATAAD